MAMYCKNCGNAIVETARFCSACGAETAPPIPGAYPRAATRPMVRPRAGRMIAGVCQGLANQYAWTWRGSESSRSSPRSSVAESARWCTWCFGL
jgi:phage shock protein C